MSDFTAVRAAKSQRVHRCPGLQLVHDPMATSSYFKPMNMQRRRQHRRFLQLELSSCSTKTKRVLRSWHVACAAGDALRRTTLVLPPTSPLANHHLQSPTSRPDLPEEPVDQNLHPPFKLAVVTIPIRSTVERPFLRLLRPSLRVRRLPFNILHPQFTDISPREPANLRVSSR